MSTAPGKPVIDLPPGYVAEVVPNPYSHHIGFVARVWRKGETVRAYGVWAATRAAATLAVIAWSRCDAAHPPLRRRP